MGIALVLCDTVPFSNEERWFAMKRLMLLTTLASLSLVATGLSQAPLKDKVKVPVAYLSIGEFSARRDPNVVPARIRVAGVVHNNNRQTVTGATFSFERWNGKGWTSIKSGTYLPIKANKPAADSLDLPASNDAMKFRYVVSPSVEGSKQFELPALAGVKKAPFKGLDMDAKVTPIPRDDVQKPKFEFLNLSIDQFYANRHAGGILVGAFMNNKNKQTVPETPYSIYQSKGTGWTRIKSGTLKPVKANGSVFESVNVPASYDAMKFKIQVSLSVQGTVECALPQLKQPPPAPVFVVVYRSYRAPGGEVDWQVHKIWQQDSSYLGGGPVRQKLRDLGFATKWTDRYEDDFFSSSHTITLSFRSEDRLERSFPTQAAAQAFQASLKGLAPPIQAGLISIPQKGVESKIVQR